MTRTARIAVIGAGIGGLAAASRKCWMASSGI
jgi:phytoene dehydrogenase-like protein